MQIDRVTATLGTHPRPWTIAEHSNEKTDNHVIHENMQSKYIPSHLHLLLMTCTEYASVRHISQSKGIPWERNTRNVSTTEMIVHHKAEKQPQTPFIIRDFTHSFVLDTAAPRFDGKDFTH